MNNHPNEFNETQEAESGIRVCEERLTPIESDNIIPTSPPFVTLGFDATEVVLLYQALNLLLRNFAAQQPGSEPLDQIDRVTGLLRLVKPAAVEASKLFAPQEESK